MGSVQIAGVLVAGVKVMVKVMEGVRTATGNWEGRAEEMPEPKNIADWWVCACVMRDREHNLSHIKLHPPSTKKCSVCKAKRPVKDSK